MLMLPLTRLGLRFKGLSFTQRWLGARMRDIRSGDDTTEAIRYARAVRLAAEHGAGETVCLPRSLVLWALLRRRGMKAELRIGVSVASIGPRRFHAWVEHNGTVVNDAPNVAEHYLPFGGTLDPGDTGF
jgi:hypothetical protein